ncbi:MAG: T9SS type A sorting domain-containing protein, partial [Bacteroidales bacterium]|nr:T9SS type A sorting domain-containing protein [Bacteroidales bacterium]
AEIAVSYKAAEPVYYAIISADGFATAKNAKGESVTSSKKDAEITVEFADRTADGYQFVSATANGKTIENGKFTMPAENVTIVTKYEVIEYIVTKGDNITSISKDKATVNDIIDVEVSVPADKILQSVVVTYGSDKKDNITANVLANKVSIQMAKYKSNITIDATLSNIEHPDFAIISADGFATAKNAAGERIVKAKENDKVTVEFKDRTAEGFTFEGATINGAPLSGNNFTMPAENVVIVANYKAVEYNITVAADSKNYVTITKSKATVSDVVTFFVANREAEDKVIEKVTVNGNDFEIHNYQGALVMADIMADAEIAVSYKAAEVPVHAIVSVDGFATAMVDGVVAASAERGASVSVTYANREAEGYVFEYASVNGQAIKDGMFVMPDKDAEISTFYTLKYYGVKAEDKSADYVSVGKDKATIYDVVTFKIANREAEGLSVGAVKVNGKAIDAFGYQGIIIMNDWKADVEVSVEYRTRGEFVVVSANEFAVPSADVAVEGTTVDVDFENRSNQGYRFVSAIYNGRPLRVANFKASFVMPGEDVLITANYSAINYSVTSDENITVDKTSATVNDKVTFAVKTYDTMLLDKVLINGVEYKGNLDDMIGIFDMATLLQDVYVSATYTNKFVVATDENSIADKLYAGPADSVRVVVQDKTHEGYKIARVTVNGQPVKVENYIASLFMGDYMSDISVKVDYELRDYELAVQDVKVNADGYCANKDVRIRFSSSDMSLDYKIRFSQEARAAGFEDIDYTAVTSHEWQEIVIPVPEAVDYGIFVGYISVRDRFGKESHDFEFKFAINYSSDLIRNMLSDMVYVDNSAHEFAGYQWIKNDVEIMGANKQYYIDAPVLYGNYGLIVTMNNGEKRRVCDLAINNVVTKTIDRTITVYPNPAHSYEDVTVSLNDFLDEDLLDAEMIIYSQNGTVMQKISKPGAINTLNLPAGVYSGVLVFGVQKMTFKFVVTE